MTNPGESSQPSTHKEPVIFSKETISRTLYFAEDPEVLEVEAKIWKSQVIIPYPNSPHAFLGPLPNTKEDQEKLSVVLPCFEEQTPLIFTQGPYDLSFLKSKFKTEPKHENNEDYHCWLNKVEKSKGQFWKDIGIFDLIQLSRQGPKYHNEMIIAALHFWNPSTNSLHLKRGMLTPTLQDVPGLTGLKPIGQTFDPYSHHSEMTIDFSRLAYGNFIKDQHNTTSTNVTDKEHIAFLTYWLSMYIFCSRSIQFPKKFKTLAIQLHEGREICLSKLILGSLYENLNQAITSIKEYQLGSRLIIPGPIWLFQLWLLATFRTQLAVHPPIAFAKAYEDRATEGIGLAMFRFGNKSSKEIFAIIYETLLKCDVFTPSLAPFPTSVCGPTWFKKSFPATLDEDEAEIISIWKAYLTPMLLSSRITAGGPYGLYGYQPNHVTR